MKARRRRSWFDLRAAIACSLLFHAALAVAFKSHQVPPPEIRFEQHQHSVEATFVPLQPPPPEPPPVPVEQAPPPPPPTPAIIAAQEAEVELAPPPPPEPEPQLEPVEPEPLLEAPPQPEPEPEPETPEPAEPEPQAAPPAPTPPPVPEAVASNVATQPMRGVQDFSDLPTARYNPPPRYPANARREGREGLVMVAIQVSPQGRVLEVNLAHSSGHDDLDQRALSAVRRWRFEPLGGRDALTFEYPIQFTLQ
ncbi:MAG: energy transducer TonB [Verrucomicrobiota bacterium JB022]|nr:energy transducer TonB [Verrucomicrobiota bacterium JB022]